MATRGGPSDGSEASQQNAAADLPSAASLGPLTTPTPPLPQPPAPAAAAGVPSAGGGVADGIMPGMNGTMHHPRAMYPSNAFIPQYYYDYNLGGYTEGPPLRPEQWEEMMRMAGGMGGPGGEGPDGQQQQQQQAQQQQQPMAALLPYSPGSPALPLNAPIYGSNMGYPFPHGGVAPFFPPQMMTSAASAATDASATSNNSVASASLSATPAAAAAPSAPYASSAPSHLVQNPRGGHSQFLPQHPMPQMQIPLHSFGGRPHPSQPSAGMSPVAAAAAAFSQLSMAQQQQQQQQGGGRGRGGQELGGRGRGGRSGAWGPGRGRGRAGGGEFLHGSGMGPGGGVEGNRGPRIARGRGRGAGATSNFSRGASAGREGGEELVGVRSFGGDEFNKPDFPVEYKMAKFFVIKSYSEDDVHKSIKYKVWTSTPNGNKRLDAAFSAAKALSEANSGTPCPIFLFFSVNGSGQFCGVAEMGSSVDFERSLDYWQQDKWMGQFSCKWHLVKDVPNSQFRHIIVAANEGKPVTNSRDTQEVGLEQGLEILSIFKSFSARTSILDDFAFYDERQKAMQERRSRSQQLGQQRNGPVQSLPQQTLPHQGLLPHAVHHPHGMPPGMGAGVPFNSFRAGHMMPPQIMGQHPHAFGLPPGMMQPNLFPGPQQMAFQQQRPLGGVQQQPQRQGEAVGQTGKGQRGLQGQGVEKAKLPSLVPSMPQPQISSTTEFPALPSSNSDVLKAPSHKPNSSGTSSLNLESNF